MADLKWLDGYSGESIEELIALAAEYRIDSLLVALEEALNQKAAEVGELDLSDEERIVLAVEALEREVSNGGFGQSVGVGLAWRSPLGMLRIDYAIPLGGGAPGLVFGIGERF